VAPGVLWFCVPETVRLLSQLAQRSARWWHQAPRPINDNSVMVLSFGTWYNVNFSDICGLPEMTYNSPVPIVESCIRQQSSGPVKNDSCSGLEVARDLEQLVLGELWEQQEAACKAPSRSWSPSAALGSCYNERARVCNARPRDQCAYAQDMARLANWVETNRRHLPRHIFAMDAPAVHHTPVNRLDYGRWRNVARAIWRKYAPSVHVLATSEVLVDQGTLNILAHDPAHWCIDSSRYELYLSALLTSIVANKRVSQSRSTQI